MQTVRVAIIGGGCAGLTAAWELAQYNASQSEVRYDITVYERTWRLGGKGASVRDESGRIREHGLHVWLGFYENAFRLMRQCHSYLQINGLATGPYDSFESAFFAEPSLGSPVRNRSGKWDVWTSLFPPMPGEPGTPFDEETNPFTPKGYLYRVYGMLKALMHSTTVPDLDAAARAAGPAGGAMDDAKRPKPSQPVSVDGFSTKSSLDAILDLQEGQMPSATPAAQAESIARILKVLALTLSALLLQSTTIMERFLQRQSAESGTSTRIQQWIEAILAEVRKALSPVSQLDEELRRKTEILDIVLTIAVGLLRDRVSLKRGCLDALDDMDCREWLRNHGATYSSLDSPFIRALYDLAFAYRNGDKRIPALAAGQGLRGALRMFFTYRGALVYRMRAGMGDVIFAPIYRALKHRGVKFEFNHTLKKATFSPELSPKVSNRVVELTFAVSHLPKATKDWSALDDEGFWPPSPEKRFRKLTDKSGQQNDRRQKVLRHDGKGSQGFDAVIMALGKDAFVSSCEDLCKNLDNFRLMSEHVATVATQSVQLWLNRSLDDLGWKAGSVIVSGRDDPLDSWADMSHLLGEENNEGARAKSVIYLCGPLPKAQVDEDSENSTQDDATNRLLSRVKENARRFVDQIGAFNHLVSPTDEGPKAFKDQVFVANHFGSDRYTLSLPGTLRYRISPLDMSVVNMTVAGDWTDCGFNEGCVEAAVMSGLLAAHAITGGVPSLDYIVGYKYP